MEKIGRNDPCWCGSGKKYKTCHMAMDEKIHHYELMGHIVPTHDMLKTAEQIEGIRESSKINVTIPAKKIGNYFPETYSKEQIEEVIFMLLDKWKQNREGVADAEDTV